MPPILGTHCQAVPSHRYRSRAIRTGGIASSRNGLIRAKRSRVCCRCISEGSLEGSLSSVVIRTPRCRMLPHALVGWCSAVCSAGADALDAVPIRRHQFLSPSPTERQRCGARHGGAVARCVVENHERQHRASALTLTRARAILTSSILSMSNGIISVAWNSWATP